MIDHASTSGCEYEQRLPAAASHGYAHVRILTVIDPDHPGPLGQQDVQDMPSVSETKDESRPRAPLDDVLRAD
ncbi:hypothetical protein [Hyphomicrobium sp.]|uniref:hypothetical protein n=1 Tax=Hyphomicrobium sp. TaxID=82 RepID=UPI002FDDD227